MKRLLIEQLLQKPRDVVLNLADGAKITLWVRPSRDPEKTMATAHARKASRNLRNLLGDTKSDQYAVLVQEELEGADKDSLRKVWVNGRIINRALEIRNASLEDREYVPNPLDDHDGAGVTPKDMDEYEDKVDKAEDDRESSVLQAVAQAQRELEEQAAEIPDDQLYEAAIPQLIESQCAHAYEVEFIAQLIMRCTFEDKACTKPAFSDIEQVYTLKSGPLTELTAAHVAVMMDGEAVKN